MKTSKEIAEKINVSHSKLMEFYNMLDEVMTTNRHFLKCTLVVDEDENWLNDVCESLEFVFYVHFKKLS